MKARTRPPEISGLTFVEPIGTGGFADVYLYEQAFPTRRVAVKVLREATDGAGLEMFHAEANVMAQLSGHPSIVPIFEAGVSTDGRAFLVMEFCPPPHLADRFRSERIPVADVLDIAVRIASAVETAHRAGILHRDIKPHNILTSAYGAPLLTDFGIASAADGALPTLGMSIPWSPPEAFDENVTPDVRSDVFSLAATVYSLLAGRSPFEIPGAANDNATLIHRIEHLDPSPVLRPDVPDSLNALLRRSLSRRLDDRAASGMAFARAVQDVQIELGLPPTRLEVMDASSGGSGAASVVEDARTEVRPISIIIPDAIAERGTLIRPRTIGERTERHPRAHQSVSAAERAQPSTTVEAPPDPPGSAEADRDGTPGASAPANRLPWLAGGLGVAVVIAVAVAAFAGPSPDDASGLADTRPSTPPDDVILGGPQAPDDLRVARRDGTLVASWRTPGRVDGDVYRVETGASLSRLREVARGPERSVALPEVRGDQVCIAVTTIREGAVSPALEDCVVRR